MELVPYWRGETLRNVMLSSLRMTVSLLGLSTLFGGSARANPEHRQVMINVERITEEHLTGVSIRILGETPDQKGADNIHWHNEQSDPDTALK